MPVAALFYLISLLETLLLVKKLKNQGFTTKRLQQTYRKFCASHLILIQKFDISVLDIHKEWNDQIEPDHTDNVVATNVKSVKWSDKLGGSLTDIHTYKLSPTE